MKKAIIGLFFCGLALTSCTTKSDSKAVTDHTVKSASKDTSSPVYVGEVLDVQDRKIMERTSPRTIQRMDNSEPLTISDIIKLSQGGVSDDNIYRYVKQTNTTYNLSQSQLRRLQQGGVSQRIVNYMVDTGR